MFNTKVTLSALSLFPAAILAQANTSTTTTSVTSDATAPAANASAAPITTTDTATTTTANVTAGAQSVVAPTVTGSQCGTAQQNFNQCVTKVSNDVSSCGTDNTCLCQTYANLAYCYNACPDLASQGTAYQQQSTQYCTIAGVKPNATTAATMTNTTMSGTNSTSSNSPSSTTTTRTSQTSSLSSPSAGTFAANSGASAVHVSALGFMMSTAAICLSVFA